MQLQTIRSQIAQLKAQMPRPQGRPPVFVLAARGPRPAGASADTDVVKHWFYADLGELEELRAQFQREYEDTRGPDDVPCVFVRLTEAAEIFEEQHRGGPVSDVVMS